MTTKHKLLTRQIGIAICSLDANSDGSIQLFPAGIFNAPRGAMAGSGPWLLDEIAATALIQRVNQRNNKIVIDYEHQTLKAAENGQPAPASGWIEPNSLSWSAGKGLFVSNPKWTDKAKAFIDGEEYKYLSPVFSYDKTTGRVLDLLHVALTNNPAIDGMEDVVLAAASLLPQQQEDASMNEELLKLLGLKKDASESDAVAALSSATTMMNAMAKALGITDAEGLAALSSINTSVTGLQKKVTDSETAIAAASAATPETAVAVITELQGTVAALTARIDGSDTDTLIAAAKVDGKLTPAMEPWARTLDVDKLKAYLQAAPQIAALTARQTNTQILDGDGKAVLTESQIAVCSQMGISQEEFKKTLAEEA